MGIQVGAKLIYGIKYKDLAEEDLEEVDALLDSGVLDYASPFYDAPRGDWIIGCEVFVYDQTEDGLKYLISDCSDDVHEILYNNYTLGFYVTPHVT